jgi:hypothetical protein
MAKNRRTSRTVINAAAAARKEERAAAQAKITARHAARREAIAQYERAESAWHDAGCVGPAPLNPRYYDRKLFPENFAPVV